MFFFSDTGREVERVRIAAGAAVAKLEVPQLVDHDAVAALVLKRAEEGAGGRVVGMDAGIAFAEVADEQRAAEDAEGGRRQRDAPRRIERAVVDAERQVANAVGIEPAHEAVADAFLIESRHGINFRVGDVERAANGLNVEWVIGVSHRRRNGRICKRETGRRLKSEGGVEDVNRCRWRSRPRRENFPTRYWRRPGRCRRVRDGWPR